MSVRTASEDSDGSVSSVPVLTACVCLAGTVNGMSVWFCRSPVCMLLTILVASQRGTRPRREALAVWPRGPAWLPVSPASPSISRHPLSSPSTGVASPWGLLWAQ